MTGRQEWARGWPIVLASLLGMTCGLAPIPFYTLGLFAPALRHDFGWTQGEIMGALSVVNLVTLALAPLVGLLVNRVGARPIAVTSLFLFGLGLMLLALSNGSLSRWYASWAVLALAGAGTLPITWTRAITASFRARRGTALGVALMGTGLFGFFGKPLTSALIARFGWREAWIGLALLPILIAGPAALALFRAPHSGSTAAASGEQRRRPGAALREWRLWLILLALLPISFALAGPIPNMEAILRSDGMAEPAIRSITPLIGLAALIGRLAGGRLLDHFWAPGVVFAILCLPVAALLLLAHGPIGSGGALVAVTLVGFAIGVEYDAVAFLIGRYFPERSFAPLYGLAYMAFLLGAGFAPMLMGWSFDRSGSFAPVLTAAAIGLGIGAALLLLLGASPLPEPDAAPRA